MTSNVEALARDWIDVKAAEDAARSRRHKIEAQLAEALPAKGEGSVTYTIGSHKITLTQGVTRKIDPQEWSEVAEHCPPGMRPVKMKLEADGPGCRYLASNEPHIWQKIASAFETKPQKIGVKVVRIDNGD